MEDDSDKMNLDENSNREKISPKKRIKQTVKLSEYPKSKVGTSKKKNNKNINNHDESFEETTLYESEIEEFINNSNNNNNNNNNNKNKNNNDNDDEDDLYGDSVYDIEEEDDESEETDDSDDDELYQISSEDEASITLQDEDLQEDELIQPDDTLILLEITGEDPGFLLDKKYSLIGLDTPNPILKIGDIFYRGQYEDIFGTQLFFRNVSKKSNNINNNSNNNNNNNNNETTTQENDINNNNINNNNNNNNNNNDKNKNENNISDQSSTKYNEIEQLVYINKTSKKIIFHKIEVEKKKLISKPSHI